MIGWRVSVVCCIWRLSLVLLKHFRCECAGMDILNGSVYVTVSLGGMVKLCGRVTSILPALSFMSGWCGDGWS